MHRIDTSGSVNGQFSNGNPAVGQLATQIDAKWLNAVQENIARTIEEAGIPLDQDDNLQLHAAILALIDGYGGGGGGGGGGVSPARKIMTAGLATGGGDLGVDRTITVQKATPAEAAAGVRDDVAVTPAGLSAINGAISISGTTAVYRNGPIIHQVFTAEASWWTETIVALPYAFPDQTIAAFVNTPRDWPYYDGLWGYGGAKLLSKTHISVWAGARPVASVTPTTPVHILAIGR